MNDRERFTATMHFQPRDRAPLYDFSYWRETIPEWHGQGLPRWVSRENAASFFGLDISLFGGDSHWSTHCNPNLAPAFEEKVIEDRGDHEVMQQADGVQVLRKKTMGSIPQHEGHLLVDRASWEEHYKPRLDPKAPERYPGDWDAEVRKWTDPHRDHPVILPGGSLYGWLRNWMGVENLSFVVFDDPELFEEMLGTVADCILSVLERILATGGKFEACAMWEDMCYNSGPLLGPDQFKQFLVPQYKRITGLLRKHGVDVTWVDCDGLIEQLIPLWLDAGVNCMFPIEIGTWGADAVKYRKQYGRDLLLMGGVDKHLLAGTKDQIEREVDRLAPLVEEGGFIPMPDHRVPPDVPLENYSHYCDVIRGVWGKNTNLRQRERVPK